MALTADLRQALRLLGRSPVFSLTSIVSLALGIAAAATIFSISDALLIAPTVGVRDSGAVIDIGRANNGSGFDNMSHPAYQHMRDHSLTVEIAAVDFSGGPMSLAVDGSSERVIGTLVSANYFDVLGTRLALGRFFRDDEDRVPGDRPVGAYGDVAGGARPRRFIYAHRRQRGLARRDWPPEARRHNGAGGSRAQ